MSREKSTPSYDSVQVSRYHGFMAGRKVTSVELSADAKKKLDKLAEHHGMKYKVLHGRVLEWFADLKPLEQTIVLGRLPDMDSSTIAEIVVRRLYGLPADFDLAGLVKRHGTGPGAQFSDHLEEIQDRRVVAKRSPATRRSKARRGGS